MKQFSFSRYIETYFVTESKSWSSSNSKANETAKKFNNQLLENNYNIKRFHIFCSFVKCLVEI